MEREEEKRQKKTLGKQGFFEVFFGFLWVFWGNNNNSNNNNKINDNNKNNN